MQQLNFEKKSQADTHNWFEELAEKVGHLSAFAELPFHGPRQGIDSTSGGKPTFPKAMMPRLQHPPGLIQHSNQTP
jgi:hypothetical protein